jgi:hypothetical protein
MAKNRKSTVAQAIPATDASEVFASLVQEAQPAEAVEDGKVPVRAPLAVARSFNFSNVADEEALAAAHVVKTAKGTNLGKARVYGYDNGSQGGGLPKASRMLVVAGATQPAGVTSGQWELLQASDGTTVGALLDAKVVASRSIRRAYRGGAIRFAA